MYIIFGYGDFGKRCIDLVGEAQVAYVVDNDKGKRNPALYPPVFSFAEKKKEMQGSEHEIVVAVSEKYVEEILQQLREEGITNYCTFREFQRRLLEKRIAQRTDYIGIYRKAVGWIQGYTVQDTGIINNTSLRRPYPEVTGYYIPSLLRWGYREQLFNALAYKSFAYRGGTNRNCSRYGSFHAHDASGECGLYHHGMWHRACFFAGCICACS